MSKKKDTGKKTLVKLSHKLYADKGTYEKIHRHLRDINDTITDEDIESVGTEVIVEKIPEATLKEQAKLNSNHHNGTNSGADLTTAEEEDMYEEGGKITSPWNIIDEN